MSAARTCLVYLVFFLIISMLAAPVYAQQPSPAPSPLPGTTVPSVSSAASPSVPASPAAPASPGAGAWSPGKSPAPSATPPPAPSIPVPPEPSASPLPSSSASPSENPFPRKPGSVPVTVNGRKLFYVYTRTTSLTKEQRAQLLSQEIQRLINDPGFEPERLSAAANEKAKDANVFYKGRYLMSVFEADLSVPGMATLDGAERVIMLIRMAHADAAKDRGKERRRQGLIYGIKGFVILLLFTILMIFATRGLHRLIDARKGTSIRAIRAGSVELISEDHFIRGVFLIYRLFLFVVYVAYMVFYLDHLLAYFPETMGFRAAIFEGFITWLKNLGISFLAYIPNLFFIILCICGARFVLGLVDRVFNGIEKGHLKVSEFYYEFREIFHRIARFVVYFFTLVLIFPNLPGYDQPIFKGLSMVMAVLVSLGSSAFMASQLAGIALIASRAYKVGDMVKIGDHQGIVTEFSLAYTRLRTNRHIDIVVSNAQVLQKEVQNFSSAIGEKGGMAISTGMSIGYEVHGDIVRALCLEAAGKTENIIKDPPPRVLQKSLDDFYVSYEIWAFTQNPLQYFSTLSELNANIRDCFDRAGVEILSPHYRNLRDGMPTTIPGRYREGKEAPAEGLQHQPMAPAEEAHAAPETSEKPDLPPEP